MKKYLVLLMVSLLCLSNINVAYAQSDIQGYIEEVFEDGSYIETHIVQDVNFARSSTTSGKKTSNYKDSSGVVLWSVTVSGTFTYNGSSATCTSSSISTTCPSSNWKLSDKRAFKFNNVAYASVIAKEYKALNICVKTVDKTVALTCDKNGKLS